MIIKFSKEEILFLKNSFLKENKHLEFFIQEKNLVELNDDLINEIRDWAGERQQIIGFNEDYELTQDGKILESLIDKLYL